eukprot:gnl/Hemi2/727_TR266_c0_g1_i1.p3 gnl/Hemi2/727_TR266_c0_g1~~gnl/Hemi2/727_TR266_c0_g1_i1.p3  ORF type:complete len:119 (-),score=8.34 gnl/Hemi2/727_TR266_c0_g1_i1:861-1187(-)
MLIELLALWFAVSFLMIIFIEEDAMGVIFFVLLMPFMWLVDKVYLVVTFIESKLHAVPEPRPQEVPSDQEAIAKSFEALRPYISTKLPRIDKIGGTEIEPSVCWWCKK